MYNHYELHQGLPSVGKNIQYTSSSIGPFKQSLARNPSYFSLVRSPDILLEKKKLKEENWKLKQMLHSTNEENLKLKQKMSQRAETNRVYVSEGMQLLNQNKYIENLQESLKFLKNDLNTKKQENFELKKTLYAHKIQQNSEPSNVNLIEKELLDDKETQIAELMATIVDLKNKLKIQQEEISILEESKKNDELWKKEFENSLKKKEAFAIISNESISILPITKKAFSQSGSSFHSVRSEIPRIFKRDAFKNEEAQLSRFFQNIFNELKKNTLNYTEIIMYLKTIQTINFTIENFISLMKHFSIKYPESETKEIYGILTQEGDLTVDDFVHLVNHYSGELDSSRSYNVSSGSSENDIDVKVKGITINIIRDPFEYFLMLVDDTAFKLVDKKELKPKFEEDCQNSLPNFVNLATLTKFLYDFTPFIEGDTEKNLIARGFMEGNDVKSKNDIVNTMVSSFFKYDKLKEVDIKVMDYLLQKISKKQELFQEKFEGLDTENVGFLSWDKILNTLYENNVILLEDIEDLKSYCYLLNHSLQKIPYNSLFLTEKQKVEKEEQVKGMITKKISLKN